jgi:hypothetical protein
MLTAACEKDEDPILEPGWEHVALRHVAINFTCFLLPQKEGKFFPRFCNAGVRVLKQLRNMKTCRTTRYCLAWLTLLFNATFLNAQENRYYIKYEKQFFNTGKKGNCNSDMYRPLWLHVFVPGVSGSAWTSFNSSLAAQTYSLHSKPSSFRLVGRIGHSSSKENKVGPHDVSYTEGMSPFTLEISGSHTSSNWLKDCVRSLSAKYRITVDDPAVITSVAFESPHDGVTYMCDNTVRVVVKVGPLLQQRKRKRSITNLRQE